MRACVTLRIVNNLDCLEFYIYVSEFIITCTVSQISAITELIVIGIQINSVTNISHDRVNCYRYSNSPFCGTLSLVMLEVLTVLSCLIHTCAARGRVIIMSVSHSVCLSICLHQVRGLSETG